MRKEILKQIDMFRAYNDIALKNEIVIYGSTFTARFPFHELAQKYLFENALYNRSVENITLAEAEEGLWECVLALKPQKVLLALGEHDLTNPEAMEIYTRIIKKIFDKLPKVKIDVLSVAGTDTETEAFNRSLSVICKDLGAGYLDVTYPASEKSIPYSGIFKQMTCFFRKNPISFSAAFGMTN